jgi:hypothetical protein
VSGVGGYSLNSLVMARQTQAASATASATPASMLMINISEVANGALSIPIAREVSNDNSVGIIECRRA